MSGIGFSEFLILCMIGLIVLGPTRLPKVASQIGSWIGQARRMTRVMRRQLEEELDFDNDLNIKPDIRSTIHPSPNDDDSYSPRHESSPTSIADEIVARRDDVDHSDVADEPFEADIDDVADATDAVDDEENDSERSRET